MWWILSTLSAHAATYTVPGNFPTLQSAIDSATVVSGDTISIAEGSFTGFSMSNGKRLTLLGVGEGSVIVPTMPGIDVITVSGGSDLTIRSATVDGVGASRGLVVTAATLNLTTAKVQNGTSVAGDGGCALLSGGSTLNATGSTFTGCSAGLDGGAIFANSNSSVTLTNSTVTLSQAGSDGGGVTASTASLRISGSTFSENQATTHGGAIHCLNSVVCDIDGALVDSNSAGSWGGGLYAIGTAPTVDNSTFDGNSASQGGAIGLSSSGALTMNGTAIYRNTATDGGGIYAGGGASLFTRNNYVCGNSATTSGHAVVSLNTASTNMANTLFAANGTSPGVGFTMVISGGTRIAHNTFYADIGGGVQTPGTAATIEDNIFTNSTGVAISGPGGNPPIRNNVVFGPSTTGVPAGQQIQANPVMAGVGPTTAAQCGTTELPYATGAAVRDVTSSTRLDIFGTRADAGHYGGPDLDTAVWGADQDADVYHQGVDCNDSNANINPGATEIPCNGVSESCGTSPDTPDVDGDGVSVCSGDCDDANAQISPNLPEVTCDSLDNDCNPATVDAVDGDGDGVNECTDCDDADSARFPGNPEICDDIDNDCNGTPDNGIPTTAWYADDDGDGYGSGLVATDCAQPSGTVADNQDCDDGNAGINPAAVEVCDDLDQDCDGVADNGIPTTDWYRDGDGDGFGGIFVRADCAQPPGTVTNASDCDDADNSINPTGIETCDGVDENCDGTVDDGIPTTSWYTDADGDGFGETLFSTECGQPPGTVSDSTDCDDGTASTFPGATELCDDVDNDCNGIADDGIPAPDWYTDLDGDGYGTTLVATDCQQPSGTAGLDGDCDDADDNTYPGAIETCDNEDDDCNGQVDDGVVTTDWYADNDDDGFGATFIATDCAQPNNSVANQLDCDDTNAAINPNATESCDGVDQDCDGAVDQGVPSFDWFEDDDNDGYGGVYILNSCQQPSGAVNDDTDCDDADPTANPGRTETCDGIDNDCDTLVDDDDDDLSAQRFYVDADGDNYGDESDPGVVTCTQPVGTVLNNSDCDDTSQTIFPLAVEACPDGIDNDCDTLVDAADPDYTDQPVVFWYDDDRDGVGTDADTFEGCSGDQPPGYVSSAIGSDCDDADPTISPLIGEFCDGLDNDCTGVADDGLSFADFYPDTDGDGYGDVNGTPINDCIEQDGYVFDNTDCDDSRIIINPDETERCDMLDNDCNGLIDDGLPLTTWYPDADGDGFGNQATGTTVCAPVPGWIALGGDCDDQNAQVNPSANEIEGDEIDNDCDGIGGPTIDTGDTGDTAIPDADGDDIPDSIDPAPNSAGDMPPPASPPTPDYGCGCSATATAPWSLVGLLGLVGALALGRRRAA